VLNHIPEKSRAFLEEEIDSSTTVEEQKLFSLATSGSTPLTAMKLGFIILHWYSTEQLFYILGRKHILYNTSFPTSKF